MTIIINTFNIFKFSFVLTHLNFNFSLYHTLLLFLVFFFVPLLTLHTFTPPYCLLFYFIHFPITSFLLPYTFNPSVTYCSLRFLLSFLISPVFLLSFTCTDSQVLFAFLYHLSSPSPNRFLFLSHLPVPAHSSAAAQTPVNVLPFLLFFFIPFPYPFFAFDHSVVHSLPPVYPFPPSTALHSEHLFPLCRWS